MKKTFIMAAVVLAALCTSCKEKEACYEVTVTSEIFGSKQSASTLMWGLQDAVEAEAKKAVEAGNAMGVKTEYTVKKANKAQADCKGSDGEINL